MFKPMSIVCLTEEAEQIYLDLLLRDKRLMRENTGDYGHKSRFSDIVSEQEFVFMGEIPQSPDHCVLMGVISQKMFVGYHIRDFELIPSEEIRGY